MAIPIRGLIRNRRFKQVNDFSGLRYGKITPTDIDGFLDFANTWFVFLEAKFAGAVMPYGQRLALERLTDAVKPPQFAVLLVSEHNHEPDEDIEMASAKVIETRYCYRWIDVGERELTVKRAIDLFLVAHGGNGFLEE